MHADVGLPAKQDRIWPVPSATDFNRRSRDQLLSPLSIIASGAARRGVLGGGEGWHRNRHGRGAGHFDLERPRRRRWGPTSIFDF